MKLKAGPILLVAVLGCLISVRCLTDLEQFSKRRVAQFVPEGWPVLGRLTSFYGVRFHPIRRFRKMHQGIDIAVPRSTPVYATAEGLIKWAGWKIGYGYCVVMDHGHGWETVYGHLQSTPLQKGIKVSSGERIGYVASSGLSTGPHLHYEVRYLDVPQNPLHFTTGFDRPVLSQR